jgi:hypothetical protein
MIIKGYKYETEKEAQFIVSELDSYYGIPVSPDAVTQHWVNYKFAELNEPQFWYIIFDKSLVPILGEPTEFEVIHPFNETN